MANCYEIQQSSKCCKNKPKEADSFHERYHDLHTRIVLDCLIIGMDIIFVKKMRGKRNSLSDQINGVHPLKKVQACKIDYQRIITQQQSLIRVLQSEIKHLRQYILYIADYDKQESAQSSSQVSISLKSCENIDNGSDSASAPDSRLYPQEPSSAKKLIGLKGLIQQVMTLLDAKNPEEILDNLKIMQEKAQQKSEPVFVQRIKYKEVPITVEVIKEVEKEILVEKVVEKVVQVPIFRERVVEKFVNQPKDEEALDASFRNNHTMKKNFGYEDEKDIHLNQTTKSMYREKKELGLLDDSADSYEDSFGKGIPKNFYKAGSPKNFYKPGSPKNFYQPGSPKNQPGSPKSFYQPGNPINQPGSPKNQPGSPKSFYEPANNFPSWQKVNRRKYAEKG